jgi:methionyl-tRNA synthetase
LEGAESSNAEKPAEIDADTFFAVDIAAHDHKVCIGGVPLVAAGATGGLKQVVTEKTVDGGVH